MPDPTQTVHIELWRAEAEYFPRRTAAFLRTLASQEQGVGEYGKAIQFRLCGPCYERTQNGESLTLKNGSRAS